MASAARAWFSVATVLTCVTAAQAQSNEAHSHLIPLPHPELLYPNEPNLPSSVLHPHVYHAPPHHLAHHQHLIPLPHPELVHPRRPASYSSSALIIAATLPADTKNAQQ